MNTLRQSLNDYLAMRRALGFKLRRCGLALQHFVSFLEEREAVHISVSLALQWAQQPSSSKPATWAGRLGYVRGFAKYLSAFDQKTEIPSWALLPHRTTRACPHLYTEEEIERLLEAALEMPTKHLIRNRTYYCLFGLLAVSGMRVSEAIELKMTNVDLDTGVLTIEGTKFGKSRLVPIHPSTQKVLREYVLHRSEFLAHQQSPYFFINQVGKRLDDGETIVHVFRTRTCY